MKGSNKRFYNCIQSKKKTRENMGLMLNEAGHLVKNSMEKAERSGFSQDRVNFHQKPGGNTAGQAYPKWPNKTGYSIACVIILGSGGGQVGGGKAVLPQDRTGHLAVRVALFIFSVCFIYSPYQYCCCYCFLRLLFC